MSWTDYRWGADIHFFCDTDNGFSFAGGDGEALLPGNERIFTFDCTLPANETVYVQVEYDTRLKLYINNVLLDLERMFHRVGLMPELPLALSGDVRTLSFHFVNDGCAEASLRFHSRVLNRLGQVVPQSAWFPYRAQEVENAERPLPDSADWQGGAGRAFRTIGRFGYTKGDGVLDYSIPSFGRISKPHVSGHPRWKRNLMWSFSILPKELQETFSHDENYVPGDGERIQADWSGVRWSKKDPVCGGDFILDYSLLSTELLVESSRTVFSLNELDGMAACRSILLPLERGILRQVDCNGVLYDCAQHGPLKENWVMLFDNGAFPEIPLLLVFRSNPVRITVLRTSSGEAASVEIQFESPYRWLLLGFPCGIGMLEPDDLSDSWIESMIAVCRRRSRTALARPWACEESFRINGNQVAILQKFSYRNLADEFRTRPLHYAPIPPPLALAAAETDAVVLDEDAADFHLDTKYGPLKAVFNSDWSTYVLPIPEKRRDFALNGSNAQGAFEDFEDFLHYHDSLKEIPNPGVHQFLFPLVIPLLTFNELTEEQQHALRERLERNLERTLDYDASYIGRGGKRCFMWYTRTEPFSGISYDFNYLHVSGIASKPDCERDTISQSRYGYIEVDWGNGIALYSIYLAALATGRWDLVRAQWAQIRKAFDYFLGLMDWACLCAPYCENGRAWSDGTNYGGYLGFVNMAEILGLKNEEELGVYAMAKMAAERLGLFVAAQKYYCRILDVPPWYTAKLFPEEVAFNFPNVSCPADLLHGTYREQAVYNMTTEGHYPEVFRMVAKYMKNDVMETLKAMEDSVPDGMLPTGPLPAGTEASYHTDGAWLGEQEVYSYLMLALFSGRFSPEQIHKLTAEAAANGRLSREWLGAHAFSYRRVPQKWCETYLKDQADVFGKVVLTLWYGLLPQQADYPKLAVQVVSADSWIEFRSPKKLALKVNGQTVPAEQQGERYRFHISAEGMVELELVER